MSRGSLTLGLGHAAGARGVLPLVPSALFSWGVRELSTVGQHAGNEGRAHEA